MKNCQIIKSNRLIFHRILSLFIICIMGFSFISCGNSNAVKVHSDSIVIATSGEPYRFFPQSSGGCGGDDNLVLCNIYDCLLKLENDGTLSPALAENYSISEDGLTYTFYLRKNVCFHNGDPMTAEDVKFTLDYGKQGPLGNALFVNYESSEVIDPYTIEVTLSAPYEAFLYGVSSRLGGIVCKKYFDEVGEEGYMAHPVGTGPYKFTEFISGDYTKLEANEEYWGGAPEIKNVLIKIVSDSNTQLLGLKNGDYDIIINPQISDCVKLGESSGLGFDVAKGTGPIVMYMSDWSGPCKDVNFRKAVQYAINKSDINTFIFENYSTPINISMCNIYGGYVDENDGIKTVTYDPDTARQYLALSNYSGEAFEITVPSDAFLEKFGKVIQAQLFEVGINCTLRTVDTMTYSDAQISRNYDAILIDNKSSLIDADLLTTCHRLDRWDISHCYQRDAEISELLSIGRTLSGDERKPYYTEVCNIITDEAYEVPLLNDIVTIGYNKRINGIGAHCLGYCYLSNLSFTE